MSTSSTSSWFDGKLGVGVTNPSALLHLKGSSGARMTGNLTNSASRPELTTISTTSNLSGITNNGGDLYVQVGRLQHFGWNASNWGGSVILRAGTMYSRGKSYTRTTKDYFSTREYSIQIRSDDLPINDLFRIEKSQTFITLLGDRLTTGLCHLRWLVKGSKGLVVKGCDRVHLGRVLSLWAVIKQGQGRRRIIGFRVSILKREIRASAVCKTAVVDSRILTTIRRHFTISSR